MKKTIRSLFLIGSTLICSSALHAQAPTQDAAFAQQMEQVDWNQVNMEIAQWVDTLPPEQQEQFYKDVDELTGVMSNMSEEELSGFMNSVLSPDQVPMLQPEMPMPPKPMPATPEAKPEPTPKAEIKIPQKPKKKIDEAVGVINTITACIERFLRKSQVIPELSGKVEQWVSQGKVREWKAGLTWEHLKGEIEKLDQKLKTMLARDPKTKQYRYLSGLIESEALYNNLRQLSSNLSTYEPKVKAPQFGLGQVSKESRNAIKEVLSAFAEGIFTLNIPKELDAVIVKYEPRAKELREEEEKAQKLALEESKKPIVMKPMQVAGKKPVYATPQAPAPRERYGDYYGGAPSYRDYDYPREESEEPTTKKTTEKPTETKSEAKEEKARKFKRDKGTDDRMTKLGGLLDDLDDLLFKPQFRSALAGAKSADGDVYNALSKMRRATNELNAIKTRLLPMSARPMYLEELKNTLDAHKSTLKTIETSLDALGENHRKSVDGLEDLYYEVKRFQRETGDLSRELTSERPMTLRTITPAKTEKIEKPVPQKTEAKTAAAPRPVAPATPADLVKAIDEGTYEGIRTLPIENQADIYKRVAEYQRLGIRLDKAAIDQIIAAAGVEEAEPEEGVQAPAQ